MGRSVKKGERMRNELDPLQGLTSAEIEEVWNLFILYTASQELAAETLESDGAEPIFLPILPETRS